MDWKVRIDRNGRMQDFNNTDKQKKVIWLQTYVVSPFTSISPHTPLILELLI